MATHAYLGLRPQGEITDQFEALARAAASAVVPAAVAVGPTKVIVGALAVPTHCRRAASGAADKQRYVPYIVLPAAARGGGSGSGGGGGPAPTSASSGGGGGGGTTSYQVELRTSNIIFSGTDSPLQVCPRPAPARSSRRRACMPPRPFDVALQRARSAGRPLARPCRRQVVIVGDRGQKPPVTVPADGTKMDMVRGAWGAWQAAALARPQPPTSMASLARLQAAPPGPRAPRRRPRPALLAAADRARSLSTLLARPQVAVDRVVVSNVPSVGAVRTLVLSMPQSVGDNPGWTLGRATVTDASTGRVTAFGSVDVYPNQGQVMVSAA